MKSHEYEFRPADLARLVAGPLLFLIVFACLMRFGAISGLLPAPWPALDVDLTILTHQAQASQTPASADILLIGDSSCLMDISGKKLDELFHGEHHPLNLGISMYVGFSGYADMLSRYASVNRGHLRTVVILLHPEMLRGIHAVSWYQLFLSDFYSGTDLSDSESISGQVRGLLGLDIFRDRLVSRTPLALPKEYGRYYGFNLDLYAFMDHDRGGAVDPHQYRPSPGQGNAEYRLAPALEAGCNTLSAAVPEGVKVLVGITALPESFAPPNYPATLQTILAKLGQWMRADGLLTKLPPVLPDSCFASTTHLNEKGSLLYTEMLANCLQSHLSP